VTVGAGVQGGQLLTAANKQDPKVAVVTGECAVRMVVVFALCLSAHFLL
jgi:hypothetical protein